VDGEELGQAIAPAQERPGEPRDISPASDPAERARKFASASRAASTLRAYRSDIRDFEAWCRRQSIDKPVPATSEIVGMYLAALADRGAAAISGSSSAALILVITSSPMSRAAGKIGMRMSSIAPPLRAA
jgi:hypothetical protein